LSSKNKAVRTAKDSSLFSGFRADVRIAGLLSFAGEFASGLQNKMLSSRRLAMLLMQMRNLAIELVR
jgi:hypothetical protein